MSTARREVPQVVTVCDICRGIIPDGTHSMDTASLTHGYIAHRVTDKTKRVWFHWPDLNRPGRSRTADDEKRAREMRVNWDFHAQCVYEVLRVAVERGGQEQ